MGLRRKGRKRGNPLTAERQRDLACANGVVNQSATLYVTLPEMWEFEL
jgi:hypothetical protein